MKEKMVLKFELGELVKSKVANTQERLSLKRIPFAERTAQQHSTMLMCWGHGSDLRSQIRYTGLAYAFVRGRRYWEVERFTKEPPSASSVAYWAGADVDEGAVKAWLEAKPSDEELASYAEHLRQAKERAREMKASGRPRRAA